jgi:hypothetical protein
MLHRHTFAPTPRKRFLPRIPDALPLTPEGYLQLRRKAAGLEIRGLAARLSELRNALIEAGELPAGMLAIRGDFSAMIVMLEAQGVRARLPETLDSIAAVMPFDPAVYRQLAEGEPPRPRPARARYHPRHRRRDRRGTDHPDASLRRSEGRPPLMEHHSDGRSRALSTQKHEAEAA